MPEIQKGGLWKESTGCPSSLAGTEAAFLTKTPGKSEKRWICFHVNSYSPYRLHGEGLEKTLTSVKIAHNSVTVPDLFPGAGDERQASYQQVSLPVSKQPGKDNFVFPPIFKYLVHCKSA